MKLETSEAEREEAKRWYNKDAFKVRSSRDIDALLAEVERLRAEYELAGEQINELETEAEASAAEIGRLRTERRPFSDGLAQKVIDEQVKTIDRLTAKLATPPTPPLPAEVERIAQRLSDLVERAPDDDVLVFHRGLIAVAASLLSRWPGGWRPIETAPKDGTKILLGKIVGHPESPTALWWATKGFWSSKWNNWNDGIEPAGLAGPTHWADLPAMPPPGAAP